MRFQIRKPDKKFFRKPVLVTFKCDPGMLVLLEIMICSPQDPRLLMSGRPDPWKTWDCQQI